MHITRMTCSSALQSKNSLPINTKVVDTTSPICDTSAISHPSCWLKSNRVINTDYSRMNSDFSSEDDIYGAHILKIE